jgi:hypothetical protein
VFST